MSTASTAHRSRVLDILRLIAVALMVANHFGVVMADRGASLSLLQRLVTDAGSHAPVVFFFCTGVGYGLKGVTAWSRREGMELLVKSALLLVADQFLRVSQGRDFWGLDFLGFIGVSMLLIGALSYLKSGVRLALALMLLVLVLRFGVPMPAGFCGPGTCGPLNWVLGKHPIAAISYPLSPWIVYPLLGFVVGRLMRALSERDAHAASQPGIDRARMRWLGAAIVVVWAALAATVVVRDMLVFRWASVSFGFFVISLGVLAAAWFASWLLDRVPAFPGIEGLASLLVVPMHYVLLKVHTAWFDKDSNFWLGLVVITIAAVMLSSLWARVLQRIVSGAGLGTYGWGALALAALAAMVAGVVPADRVAAPVFTLLGVSVVALSLASRPKRVAPPARTAG